MAFSDTKQMAEFLEKYRAPVEAMLDGGQEEAEKAFHLVLSSFKSAAIRNPKWLECEAASLIRCAMWCAHLGLYPGGYLPDVYLIPRNEWRGGEKVRVLNAQPSWRGLKTLVERAGCGNVRVRAVYTGDLFEVSDGTQGAFLRHEPTFKHDDDFEKLIACYVLATLPSGTVMFHVISKRAIERHRGASDSFKANKGPWVDHPVPMAMKTAIADAVSRGTLPINDGGKALGGAEEIELIDIVPNAIEQKPAKDPALLSMGLRDEDLEVKERETVEVIALDPEPEAKAEKAPSSSMDPRSIAWERVFEREEGFTPERLDEIRIATGIKYTRVGQALSSKTRTSTLDKYAHELHKAAVSDKAGAE